MSQLRKTVHGRRRISALLFSLLRRLDRWLAGWLQRQRARWARKPAAPGAGLHFELLEPRLLLSADLVGGSLSHDAFTSAVPGDPVSALFEVYRPDSEPLTNPVRIQFYASADSVLDTEDTLVGQTDLAADSLHPGNNAITVSLDTRATGQPGRYTLIGVVDPDNAIAESDETNNQSLASSPLTLDFAVGQLPGRAPVPALDLTDADGTHLRLTIAGPGIARLTPNGTGYDLSLSGTDAGTRIDLTGSGGDGCITLTGLNADSPFGSLAAPIASLTGVARFATVNTLNLGDIAAGARLEGNSLASLNVSRDALGDLRLTGSGVSGFVLGAAQVGGAIGGLWSINGRANSISGQSTRADWRANISSPLTQLVIRGDASGQFAASALQLLQVGGSLKAMSVRIGANLGSDAVIGGSGDAADHFGAGTLARLRVSGDIDDSLIVIGVNPHNGRYHDGDDRQLGTSTNRVQELLVGGRLTGDTQISAPAFPASVRINGVLRSPASLSELASTPPDRRAPTLTAALANDSGTSTSDRLTRDATLSGQASDAAGVTRLLAALDPAGTPPLGDLSDLSSALQPDGRFVLTPALLDTLSGGPLADGTHRVHLVATDAAGNASAPVDLAFTLDTAPPALASFTLDPASDTGTLGDRETSADMATLLGQSEPGTTVSLTGSGLATTADASGAFRFADLPLALGDNAFAIVLSDFAGNTTAGALTVTRVNPPVEDHSAPTLAATLLADTGRRADDGITRDATITGTVSDDRGVTRLRAGFGSDSASFVDILDTLQADGHFTLDMARLAAINGGALPDGRYTLRLVAGDAAGNSSAVREVAFTLDTTPPAAPILDLVDTSDSGASTTDNLTRDTTPTLTLAAEDGSEIALLRDGTPAGAGLTGPSAEFTADPLADGTYTFSASARDLAGNLSATGALAITLDSTPPVLASFTLDPASDTGTPGDRETSATLATLLGQSEPGTTVSLTGSGLSTTADATGAFRLADLPLALGDNAFQVVLSDAAGNETNGLLVVTRLALPTDTTAPTLSAALVADTGASASDGLTFDARFAGTASDDIGVVQLLAQLDPATADAPFTDLTTLLATDGTFALSRSTLDALAGGTLADGAHTLRFVAVDAAGNRSNALERHFTLDTTAPTFTGFGLSVSDATNAALDETTAGSVLLKGSAEAGAAIRLAAQDIAVVAGAGGAFVMPGVALALGANELTLTASDAAGNTTTFVRTLTRTVAVQADAVLEWNDLALRAVQLDVTDPPVATRTLAMVSLAQYDALAAIEGTPAYLVSRSVSGPVSASAAVAVAAHRVLSQTYPAQQAVFDSALAADLAAIVDGEAKDQGIALGLTIADAVLALRAHDGAEAFVAYDGSSALGQWRPTGPMFDVADDPQWGTVQPFALRSPDQFRPAAPPTLDTGAYAAAVEEVKRLGSATSSERTADQTVQALFWADGKGSYTPPGHWNQIAEEVARDKGNSLAANARLFAQLNVALADAAIACWDAKYAYGLWRPETAIQNADLDDNAATTVDSAWRPLLLTPPHPEYVSGHSTFSAAAAGILAATFGDATAFSTTSATLPGVTRSFTSFTQAAQEAGRSRIYGGIHYEFTNQAGQQLGTQVAEAVLARFALTSDTQAPAIVLDDTPAAINANLTLTGQVLDNLSGVASAQFQIDDGALQTLVLDATGGFTVTTALATDGSADGAHTITIVARDAAGNANAGVTRGFVLDTLAPTLTLASLADGDTLSAASRLAGTADATGSALTQLSYRIDGGTSRSLIFDASGAFDEALTYGDLDVGSHALVLTARDAAGNLATLTRTLLVDALASLTVTSLTPTDGSDDVGVTVRPQVRFSRAVDAATLTAESFYATGPDDSTLAATIVPANDGTFAWLFFTTPMPGASQVTLHVDGSKIRGAADGRLLDADGDGTAGGTLTQRFTTVSRSAVIGTTLVGKVVDPGPDLEPMSFDDIRRGADGVIHTPDDVFLLPIAHAKVYLLGLEDRVVYTDENGNFELTDVPAGTVKVAVDGRTATNAPTGVFFPEMVMDVELIPGITNTVMGGMGSTAERQANVDRREVYLPRVPTNALQRVSDTETTVITLTDAASAPQLSEQERAALTLTVPPGSAIGEDGHVLDDVQIGISTVPPELVRDMLPPGVLQHTFDITIQAPGVAAFAEPVQITFPNVFHAAPGTKLNILSFDHTTGMLVINGTGTVSADGLTVVSDPDSGIKAPGWHGLTPPGRPNDPPCDPTIPHDVNVPPVPVTTGLHDYLFTDDSGSFTFGIGNAAAKIDPTKDDCDPVNARATPLLVTITVKGTPGDFLDNWPGTPTLSMTLSPSQQESYTVTVKDLLTATGLDAATANLLYGMKVKVEGKQEGKTALLIDKTFHVYRLFDTSDADHADSRIDFERTYTDDIDGALQSKPITFVGPASAAPTLTPVTGVVFDYTGGQVRFDPILVTGVRTDALRVITPARSEVGQIQLRGTAVGQQGVAASRAGFESAVESIVDALLPAASTSSFRSIFPADSGDFLWFVSDEPGYQAVVDDLFDAMMANADSRFGTVNVLAQQAMNVLDGTTGGTTVNWVSNASAGDPPAFAKWADFSKTIFTTDSANETSMSLAEQKFRFDQITNRFVTDPLTMNLNIQAGMINGSGTPLEAMKILLGNNLAHEVGHDLGAIHLRSASADYIAGDIMGSDGSSSITRAAFSATFSPLVKFSLGLPVTDAEFNTVYAYYKSQIGKETYLFNNAPMPGTHGFDDLGDHTPLIVVFDSEIRLGQPLPALVDGINLGTALADGAGGAVAECTVYAFNDGSGQLDIESIEVTGEGLSLVGVAPAPIHLPALDPGNLLPTASTYAVTLRYDPTRTGKLDGRLIIESNADGNPVLSLPVAGNAISPYGDIRLEVPNNNLGGQRLGGAANQTEFGTVYNDGAADLIITSFITTGDFAVTGAAAAASAALPIVVRPGESFRFGVSFAPGDIGLRSGRLTIVSNDPDAPSLVNGLVGTGLAATGTALKYGNNFVALEIGPTGNKQVNRSISDAAGNWSFFLPVRQSYHNVIFDAASGLVSHSFSMSALGGARTHIPTPVFLPSTSPDSDFDGLPDDIEFAIGTSSAKSDSDRDGLDDFAEVDMGLNPLDGRGLPAGVLAVTGLLGEAREVVLAGRTDGSSGQLAYVATGSYGLAIVDPRNMLKPVVVGQLELPGDAVDVSLDSRLGLAAVATGVSVEVVDVSNSNAPRVARSIPVAARQVEVVDGVAYVAVGNSIESYKLLTGEHLDSVPSGAGDIVGLAAERGVLFAVDVAGRLAAIDISGAMMTLAGGIDLPTSSGKVFVGGGIAYVGGGATGGFVTVDVSDPSAMVLLSGVDSTAIAGNAIVATGSGDALTLGTSAAGPVLSVADVRDPTRTDQLVNSFRLPATAHSLAVGSGLAFIAGGTGGLVVVNYRSFDTEGKPPIVTVSAPGADIDPATDGIQVLEGTTLALDIAAQDDRQIARVELLVDGQVAISDVSYPWPGSVVLPTIKGSDNTVSIRLRAVDTGGNVGLSTPIDVQLVRDTVAPALVGSNAPDGAVRGTAFRVLTLEFSEAIAAGTVTPSTVVLSDASGTVIAAQDVQLWRNGVELQVTYPPLAEGAYQLRLVAPAITDRAGNPLGATDLVSSFTIRETHTVEWIGSRSGFWDDPANWSSGVLPGPGDDVVINVAPGGLIDHRAGATTIRSLTANGNLQLSGGTLELTGDSSISGAFTLTGGTLSGAGTLTLAGTGNRWDGGTMTGSGTTRVAPAADLLATGRLGALTLAERTIRNDGTIVVDRGAAGEVLIQPSGAALIRNLGTFEFAGRGRIGDATHPVAGPRFENQGLLRVRADAVLAVDLGNAGTIEVSAGARLSLAGAGTGNSSGAFLVAEGATLSLPGRQRFESTASASGGGRLDLGSSGRLAIAGGRYDLTVALADGAELSIEAPTTIRFLEMTGGAISGTGPLTLTLPQSELLGGTITVPLIEPPDTVRPTIIDSSVTDGAAYGLGLGRITLRFSEAMRPESLVPGHFFLLNDAGERIDVLSVSIGARFRSVTLEVPRLTTGGYRLVVAGDQLEDHRAGNRLADGDSTIAAFRATPRLFDGALYPTGDGTRSAVLGDLDGDGDMDIVTANSSSVSVLLGNGDGTFAERVDYAFPGRATSVTLGDVDGDGDLDIVTANYSYSDSFSSSSASVLLGNGDGSFAERVDYALPKGGRSSSVALGDVDGDGDLDIVTSSSYSYFSYSYSSFSFASVLLGNGDGSFAARVDYALPKGGRSSSVALGDVDGDGDLDIVTSTSSYFYFSSASVLLGNGDGSFAARVDYALPKGGRSSSVALGDVDGDGDLDIVTSSPSYYSYSYSSSASVLLGNGDGSFAARVDYALPKGARSSSVALGDVDGDGDLDIVTANSSSYYSSSSSASASVLLGNGDGSFAARVDYALPRGATSVTLGDVDGDGDLDIVTANYSSSSSSASVLLGNGDGSFAARVDYALDGGAYSVKLGDVDGDGDLDIVTANYSSSSASVLLGNGDGSFAAQVDYALPRGAFSVTLGDVDGDGDLDIVTANYSSSASVLLGNGDGSFAAQVDYGLPRGAFSVTLGDVDGDGDLDIVTANYSSSSASVLLGNGDGSFAAQVDYALPRGAFSVTLGDVDGDGDLDIVTANLRSSSASVLLGNGDGSFAAQVDYGLPGGGAYSVTLGDVDGDGDLDIVTAKSFFSSSSASVLLGNGDGSFAAPGDYALPRGATSVTLGDVDGDGDLDIVTANNSSSSASVLLGNGDGSFAAQGDYALPQGAFSVTMGDVDGDGDLDIVTANTSSSASVLLNRLR